MIKSQTNSSQLAHKINIAVFSNENNHAFGDKKASGNNQFYIIEQLKSACNKHNVDASIIPLTSKTSNVSNDKIKTDYAVVRCATQECCDKLIEMHKEQALKSIFIIGAGINDFVNLAKQNPIFKEIPVIRNDNLDIANDMADYALMHCLMQYRDMPYYLNAQQNKNYAPLELHKKSDFPVGIMGGGNLGGTVAKALTQNGFNVQIWKRTAGNVGDIKCLHGQQDLGKFLSSTRILINLLPLTQETTGILNKELLSQLPNKSIVMNLARGQHQKTDDIIKLLNNGKLSHAVLDVTEEEPIPKNNPIWQNPKVTLTQHTAAKTRIDNACETHIQKISELQKGKNMKQISGRVDLEQGY